MRFYIALILVLLNIFAKADELDSLKRKLKENLHDTTRCVVLNKLTELEYDDRVWPLYNMQMARICIKYLRNKRSNDRNFYLEYIGLAINNFGYVAQHKGEIEEALKYYHLCLNIFEILNKQEALAGTINNIGLICKLKGDMPLALNYYHKSLIIYERMQDIDGISTALNNLGALYRTLKEYEKAMENYTMSLKYSEELKDSVAIARVLSNIGNIFNETNKQRDALRCYLKSKKIQERFKEKIGLANSLSNLGSTYLALNNLDSALMYFEKNWEIRKTVLDKAGLCSSHRQMANVLNKKGDYQSALEHALKSTELAEKINYLDLKSAGYYVLSESYSKLGLWKEAFSAHKRYKMYNDSLNSKNLREATFHQQYKSEYDKKAAADSVLNYEENRIVQIKLKQSKTQKMFLWGGIIALFAFAGYVFYNLRKKIRINNLLVEQKLEIEKQNDILDKKNILIHDSIEYATNIQFAMFTPLKKLKSYFSDFLIAFQPKDKVSGDFYWAFQYDDNKILIVTADCTGHGVPGAFMSVLGMSILEKIVGEQHLQDPKELLLRLNNNIYESLSRGGAISVNDGMDVAIMLIDNDKNNVIFSASMNNAYVVKQKEIKEFKGEVISLGRKPLTENPFVNHCISFDAETSFYMLTDGYCDQRGGPENKKFFPKLLREKLLEIQHLPMKEQKEVLLENFNSWKGNKEQIDDVLIFGFKPFAT